MAAADSHLEDVGAILLGAQRDIERVRQTLLPVDPLAQPAPQGDAVDALREVLNRTELSLRTKAEAVLRSTVDSTLNSLPPIRAPGTANSGLFSTADLRESTARTSVFSRSAPEFRLQTASTFAFSNTWTRPEHHALATARANDPHAMAILTRAGIAGPLASVSVGSSSLHRAVRRSADLHILRPVRDKMRESKTLELMAKPHMPAGRQLLQQKYSIGPPPHAPPRVRPIERYGESSKRAGRVVRGSMAQPNVLPKLFRKNPRAYPELSSSDTHQGVYSMVNRGLVPAFIDLGGAFDAEPSPFRAAPAALHNFSEQFQNKGVIAPHAFNAANLRFDLGDAALGLAEEAKQPEEEEFFKPEDMQPLEDSKQAVPVTEFQLPSALQATTLAEQAKIRDYDELLDAYSLHQFIIRKGHVLASTPEFMSFQRKYSFMWGAISKLVVQLESLVVKLRVDLAYCNGQRVVELAEDDKRAVTEEDLVSCLENVDRHALLRSLPQFRYASEEGPELAASKLQATFRMYQQKQKYKQHKHRVAAARVIQRVWRRWARRQQTRRVIELRRKSKLEAWRVLVAQWRKDWASLGSRKRVIVHVPSLSLPIQQRLTTFNFALRQNMQLSRLCDVADPNVEVIYLSPYELSAEVVQYYMKLLEIGGVKDAAERIQILVPENVDKFPEHFSLAKQALYSPKVLKKIRALIAGRPAYLVPGELGSEDLDLALALNLPMLSGEPEVAQTYGCKSGNKRIFAAAQVPVPIGAHDVYDEDDFYHYFSKLIVDNIDVSRWVLKIDNETSGRGLAYFKASEMKVVAALRLEKESHLQRWTLPEILSAAQDRVLKALRRTLPNKVVLACPTLYQFSWANYAKAFFRVGGVIEACPETVLSSPSANVFIHPDGTVDVSSSHDQIFSTPFVFAGSTFPSSAPAELLHSAAQAVGKACFAHGICGHAGVDFVLYYDPASDSQRLCAVDLDLCLTPSQASFAMFQFLTKGQYRLTAAPDNPHRIRYTLPAAATDSAAAATAEKKASATDDSLSSQPDSAREDERCFACINSIYQPALSTMQFSAFFNVCRMRGISFDLRNRVGTAFLLMDSLASATLGVFAVGKNSVASMRSLVDALLFLEEQVNSQPPLPTTAAVYDEESNLREVLAVSKAILKAKQAAAAMADKPSIARVLEAKAEMTPSSSVASLARPSAAVVASPNANKTAAFRSPPDSSSTPLAGLAPSS